MKNSKKVLKTAGFQKEAYFRENYFFNGVFSDSENIIADSVVTHTTSYAANIASGTTFSSSASGTGSAVTVEAGIYYIRGTFVRNEKQTVVLSNTSKTETARVGFLIKIK